MVGPTLRLHWGIPCGRADHGGTWSPRSALTVLSRRVRLASAAMVTWSCSTADRCSQPTGRFCSNTLFRSSVSRATDTPIAVNPADAVLSRSGVCTLYIAAEGRRSKNCGSTSSDSVLQTNALGASFPARTNLSISADGSVASWLQEVDTGDASPTATRQLFVRHATGLPRSCRPGPMASPWSTGSSEGGSPRTGQPRYRQPGRLTRLNGSDGQNVVARSLAEEPEPIPAGASLYRAVQTTRLVDTRIGTRLRRRSADSWFGDPHSRQRHARSCGRRDGRCSTGDDRHVRNGLPSRVEVQRRRGSVRFATRIQSDESAPGSLGRRHL